MLTGPSAGCSFQCIIKSCALFWADQLMIKFIGKHVIWSAWWPVGFGSLWPELMVTRTAKVCGHQ
jgi:hypothetical protein